MKVVAAECNAGSSCAQEKLHAVRMTPASCPARILPVMRCDQSKLQAMPRSATWDLSPCTKPDTAWLEQLLHSREAACTTQGCSKMPSTSSPSDTRYIWCAAQSHTKICSKGNCQCSASSHALQAVASTMLFSQAQKWWGLRVQTLESLLPPAYNSHI